MPDDFLSNREPRTWKVASAPDALEPISWWPGNGDYRLEVALARAGRRPRAQVVRELWRTRQQGGTPVELVVLYPAAGETRVAICGPMGPEPPVIADMDLDHAERLMAAALDAADGHAAVRLLLESTEESSSALPGIVNQGLLAIHDLVNGVPSRADWSEACERAVPLLERHGRNLVEGLGYKIEQRETLSAELLVGERRRALAVFLDDREEFDRGEARFDGQTPVSYALAVANSRGLPWVVVTRGSRIRLYSSDPNVGVGMAKRAASSIAALGQVVSPNRSYIRPRRWRRLPRRWCCQPRLQGTCKGRQVATACPWCPRRSNSRADLGGERRPSRVAIRQILD